MEQMNDCRLEMSLMLPAALAGEIQTPVQVKKGDPGGLKLRVEVQKNESTIIMRGAANAEAILDGLLKATRALEGRDGLHLDLTRAEGFDQLGLSALVVVLREQGGKFKRLTLSGLPPWACGRLIHTGAENLLGHNWSDNFAPGMVSFYRR